MHKNMFQNPTGKGASLELAESIKDAPSAKNSTVETLEIHISHIIPDPDQPRSYFPDEMLKERLSQLESEGQVAPITVWPPEKGDDGQLTYQLYDGECRWRAASLDGSKIDYLRAEIKRDADKSDVVSLRIGQLLHNDDGAKELTVFEEAKALSNIIDELKRVGCDDPQNELARRLGKDKGIVSEKLKVAALPDSLKSVALRHGINDSRTISSMLRINKIGSDEDMGALLDLISGAAENKSSMRSVVTEFLKDVKSRNQSTSSRKKKKKKKIEKKIRQLSVMGIDLQIKDGLPTLILETPREKLKLNLTTEQLETIKTAGDN